MVEAPREKVAKIHIDHNARPVGIEPIILHVYTCIYMYYTIYDF